jgi:hypothetical protein
VTYPFPLYGRGMHDFVMTEIELGKRVVLAQDMEDCGFSALDSEPEEPMIDDNSLITVNRTLGGAIGDPYPSLNHPDGDIDAHHSERLTT